MYRLLTCPTPLSPHPHQDWGLFFSSVSYSIGDDVFSLAELEQCVLRGRLSRPRVTSRHEPTVLSLSDSHFAYALDKVSGRVCGRLVRLLSGCASAVPCLPRRGRLFCERVSLLIRPPALPPPPPHTHSHSQVDCRVNFMLNSGSVSNPESIYLLTPRNLEQQLNTASQATLTHSMSVDFDYHTVTLPKRCDVYRSDLGGEDASKVLHTCLKYLANTNCFADLESILADARVPTIKYLLLTYESRSKLVLTK